MNKKLKRVISISVYLLFLILYWRNNPAYPERYISRESEYGYVKITEDINEARHFNTMEEIYDYQNRFHKIFKKDYEHGFDMQQWYIKEIIEQNAGVLNTVDVHVPTAIINTVGNKPRPIIE